MKLLTKSLENKVLKNATKKDQPEKMPQKRVEKIFKEGDTKKWDISKGG